MRGVVIAAVLAAVLASPPARAADPEVEAFYKGRQLRLIAGSSVGAGFDLYARAVARHLGKFIPGSPTIVPGNLPGAGSMRAVQSLRAEAKDGTYIVLFNPGQIMATLLTPEQFKGFRFTEVAFLGSASAEIRTCFAWHTTGVRTLADLLRREKPFATGHTGSGAATYIEAAIIKNVLGAKLKQITGYPGLAEQRIAVERGELDGDCGPFQSIPPDWITDGKAHVLVRISKAFDAATEQYPWVGATASPEQQKLIELVLFYHEIFRPFIVARETPASRLAALREAFWRMVGDAGFREDALRQGREVIAPMKGEDVERLVAEVYRTPPDIIAKAVEIIK